uniref:Uncharacterized protein n=1 Tax=Rhizophora mucronata TaxID=61149 RepID=A0A2P2NCT3_RHIMU
MITQIQYELQPLQRLKTFYCLHSKQKLSAKQQ